MQDSNPGILWADERGGCGDGAREAGRQEKEREVTETEAVQVRLAVSLPASVELLLIMALEELSLLAGSDRAAEWLSHCSSSWSGGDGWRMVNRKGHGGDGNHPSRPCRYCC